MNLPHEGRQATVPTELLTSQSVSILSLQLLQDVQIAAGSSEGKSSVLQVTISPDELMRWLSKKHQAP